MTVKRWRTIRDRLVFVRTLVHAFLLITSAAMPLRAEATEVQGMRLASYSVMPSGGTRPVIFPDIYLVGASYHLQISNKRYQNFIMGCYDSQGAYYIWNQNLKEWKSATGAVANYLSTLKDAASGYQVRYSRQHEITASIIHGYEDNIEFTAFRETAAGFNADLASPLEDSLVAAPMPGGMSGLPLDRELNFILALFAAGSGRGDILLFSRPVSWFSGEAELFNATDTLRGASYRDKALSLLYERYKKDNLGNVFAECIRQHYGNVNLNLFQGYVQGKDAAMINLGNTLGITIIGQFSHTISGQKFFNVSRSLPGQPFLYGQNRNIYIDAYLLFCYSQNKPLFESRNLIDIIRSWFLTESAFSRRQFSPSEGLDLARLAMRYFTWGMEYSTAHNTPYHYRGQSVNASVYGNNQIWNRSSYEPLKGLPSRFGSDGRAYAEGVILLENLPSDLISRLESPFEGATGFPLPYAAGGTDTPASFAGRVQAVGGNASRSIQPAPSRAGVDGLGFLSGCIAMRGGLGGALPGGTSSNGTVRRLGLDDLGKISVIIPDLSLVRPGDMVLQFYQAGFASWIVDAAIVVGFKDGKAPPAYGGDQRQDISNILILGPQREIGQVSLAAWTESVSGSRPETFHIRRLLIHDDMGLPPRVINSSLPDIKVEIVAMYEQDRQLQSGPASGGTVIRERWIPNTGEFLLLPGIEIRATSSAGENLLNPNTGDMELILSGAVDRFYDPGKSSAEYGNIYNNSGGSKFEVALIPETADQFFRLGVLEYDGAGRYNMNYEGSVLYAANGLSLTKSAEFTQNRLWIDRGRRLNVLYQGRACRLGIRPLKLQFAKPGDDLILEFALRDKGSIAPLRFAQGSSVVEARFQVLPKDYIALYDKKLIWRANLYIDENTNGNTNGNDWNDIHPWKAPASAASAGARPLWWREDWGYNEWNQVSAGTDSAVSTDSINGRQITNIMGWTHWDTGATASSGLGYKSVAYGWGCMDSVAEFDSEMDGQKQAIAAYIQNEANQNSGNPLLSEQSPSTDPGAARGPNGGDWNNYVFPAREQINITITTNNGNGGTVTTQVMRWTYPTDTTGIQQYTQHPYYTSNSRPSVPGLSTYWAFSDDNENRYHDNQSAVTAGIDCSGFVQRSAGYSGNIYAISGAEKRNTTKIAERTMSYLIFGGTWTDAAGANTYEAFSRAVPGDVLVKGGDHVVLVQDTSPNPAGIVTGRGQVTVIQASKGDKSDTTWNVNKTSAENFVTSMAGYHLVRLR